MLNRDIREAVILLVDDDLADTLEIQASAESTTLAAVMRRAEEARQLADKAVDDHLRDRQAELAPRVDGGERPEPLGVGVRVGGLAAQSEAGVVPHVAVASTTA